MKINTVNFPLLGKLGKPWKDLDPRTHCRHYNSAADPMVLRDHNGEITCSRSASEDLFNYYRDRFADNIVYIPSEMKERIKDATDVDLNFRTFHELFGEEHHTRCGTLLFDGTKPAMSNLYVMNYDGEFLRLFLIEAANGIPVYSVNYELIEIEGDQLYSYTSSITPSSSIPVDMLPLSLQPAANSIKDVFNEIMILHPVEFVLKYIYLRCTGALIVDDILPRSNKTALGYTEKSMHNYTARRVTVVRKILSPVPEYMASLPKNCICFHDEGWGRDILEADVERMFVPVKETSAVYSSFQTLYGVDIDVRVALVPYMDVSTVMNARVYIVRTKEHIFIWSNPAKVLLSFARKEVLN